jgi:hypothetical protein
VASGEITANNVDALLYRWRQVVGEERARFETAFALSFESVTTFDPSVAPAIRKFAREHEIRNLHLMNCERDAARLLLNAFAPFFNLQMVSIDGPTPNESIIVMPIVLRKTTSSILALHFSNIKLELDVLEEWASISFSGNPALKKLMFKNVLFGGEERGLKAVATVLRNFRRSLVDVCLESHSDQAPLSFRHLGKSFGSMESLIQLTLCGVAVEAGGGASSEQFFGAKSKLRICLEDLSMIDCGLSSTIVTLLIHPRPFRKLKALDVSSNELLLKKDINDLLLKYPEVVSDVPYEVSRNLEESSSEDDVDDDAAWDFSQPAY